ncbi:metal ABC transporter ATP-binding protein [Candidatus Protochlamydia phocaeensis]|uniref:metal ABC transporter ATP-binding protein n=1 Tax=Candidatus Protochlamydia phocaeensis TaxID=1414722 RepID=UPI000839A885|nr:metal ABC transporter ATP-binding protein [Candidatus Protochlamydia phocaeensis]
MPPIIELENVFFSYQNTPVLSQVSFKVYPGEFIGIIGPNGGGKTTLLRLLMGFLKPSQGKIRLFGKAPGTREKDTPCLAYVPQAMRFDREFPISVLEVVLSGLLDRLPWYGRFHAKDKQAALEALDKVGLAAYSRCSFGTLSGGQAQRVLIARALVSEPQLLLLDEPTASVDSRAEADIYALLEALKGQLTILMVTHDLRAAIEHVQRLLCVQGQVFSLKPEEVCEHFVVGLYHTPLIQPGYVRPPLPSTST